jgi:hypothetical protein
MLQQENIFKFLKIEGLPMEQKARILESAAEMVEQRLLLRIFKTLPEYQRNEFNLVLAGNDKAKLEQFVAEHFPDFLTWVEEESIAVREELASIGDIDN